jgi:hypothetical protein
MLNLIGETPIETRIGAPAPHGRTTNAPAANHRPVPFLNDIRILAYKKWTAAGQPPGDCTRFWLEAEQEIQGRNDE